MANFYPELKSDFWEIIEFSPKHTYIIIKCKKCSARWRVEKKNAEKKHGILRLLDHEYGHLNRP